MDDRCENNLKSSDRLKQEANDLAYCGMMTLTNKIRKKINIERVGAVYDFNLSVKENLKLLAEHGIVVSQAKLYRLKKDNFKEVEIS